MSSSPRVIIDTGPLVAYFDKRDRWHDWTVEIFAELHPPLISCEAVVTECYHILGRVKGGRERFIEFLSRGVMDLSFSLAAELPTIKYLLNRYRNLPNSVADACLVRLAELHPKCRVCTLNEDFAIYRKNRREKITLLCP